MQKHLLNILLILALIVPSIAQAQTYQRGRVEIGDGTTAAYYVPFENYYRYSTTQVIYPANDIDATGDIDTIWYYCQGTNTLTFSELKVYMTHTTQATIASPGIPASSYTQVYSGTNVVIGSTSGWYAIVLDTAFHYNGIDNLAIAITKSSSSYSSALTWRYTASTGSAIYRYSDSDVSAGSLTGTATYTAGVYRANIRLSMNMLTPACAKPQRLVADNVSSESATIHWTDTNNVGSYMLYHYPTDSISQMDSLLVYDTTFTLTNLSPLTSYTVKVATDCGSDGLSTTRSVTFQTPCEAIATSALPYTYGFEDATASGTNGQIDECWGRHVIGGGTNYPYPYTNQKHSGTYSLYFYNNSATTASRIYSWATLPQFESELNTLQLSFWAYKSSGNYGHMVIGVTSDPNDISTFDTISVIDVSTVSTWEYFEISFASYHGTGNYITLLSDGPALSYTYVDDITVDVIPACPRPTSLEASNVSLYQADLSWDENGTATEWLIEYTDNNFETGNVHSEVAYTNPYAITNLSPSTIYQVRIASLCTNGDTSTFSTTEVRTACGDAVLPFFHDFEHDATGSGSDLPHCWTRHNDYVGTSSTSASYPYVNNSAANAHSGTHYLYFYLGTGSSYPENLYAVLPAISTNNSPMSNNELLFWGKSSSTTVANLIVGVMTDADSINTFEPIDTVQVSGNTMTQYTVSLANYNGNGKYIALHTVAPATAVGMYLDDIEVRQAANCATAEDVTVVAVTESTATLTWSGDDNHDGYQVYYGLAGFNQDTASYEYVSDTTYTIEGLQANTDYEFFVVASCGLEEAHATSRYSFTTECAAIDSLPYTEDFERYNTGSSATIDPCWYKNTNYSSAYPYPYATAAIHGNVGLYFYGNSSSAIYSYAVLPSFTADINTLRLRFNVKRYNSTSANYHSHLLVGVMSNATDINTFDTIADLDYTSAAASSIHEAEVFFDNYTGTGGRIAILAPAPQGTSSQYNYVYIDDITVDLAPDCRRSFELTASNVTATSADLSWSNASADVTSYQVAYSTDANFDPDTCTLTLTTTTPQTSLTNLDNYTTYYWAVATNCGNEISEWSLPAQFTTLFDCGSNAVNIIDTIGDGTSATGAYTMYCSTTYPAGYSTNIFTVEELAAMGLQNDNRINSIRIHCGTTGGTISDVDVYMTETDLSAFGNPAANDTLAVSNMTHLFHGNVVATPNQWVEIVFDSAFHYDGMHNLMLTLRRGTTSANATFYYTTTSPDYRNCYGYKTATGTTFSASRTYYRTNMVFNVCSEIPSCDRPTDLALSNLQATSVDVAWTGHASNYEVAYGPAGFDPDTAAELAGTHAVTSSNSYSLSGLTANSIYEFYVRSICSDNETSGWSLALTINTPCEAMTLPYTEDFEAYGTGATNPINPCWAKGTNNTTQYPYPYATNAVSGVRSLYFYAYRPSSTTSAQYYSYAALPAMDAPIDTLMLTFSMRRYSTTTDYYTTRMVIGVMTDPTDITTFQPVDTIDMKDELSLAVKRYEVPFNNYHGNGRFIAFYDEVPPLYGSSTYTYSYAYVDDVMVDYIPTCFTPIDVTANNVTANSATITWTDRNTNCSSWELEYGPTGFTHGNGTSVYPTTNSMTLTGLTNGIFYDVYVRNVCTAGDTSNWSMIYTFNTECGMISTLPYQNGFENESSGGASITTYPQFVTCWTRFNNSNTASYQGYPYVSTTTTYVHSGTKGMYFYAAAASTTTDYPTIQMAVMPQVDITVFPMNTLQVNFFAKRNASYATKFYVGVMSDPSNAATFTAVDSIMLTTDYDYYEVPLSSYTGNGSYVAFRLDRTSTIQYAYLDDVEMDLIPTCLRPDSLVADSATSNSILLSWYEAGDATQWAVEYGPEGFVPGTGTTVIANSNPFRLTGLPSSTRYQAYVRAICDGGDTSRYCRVPVLFSTSQMPATLPYFYNFEDSAEWANWQTNSNQNVNWYRGTAAGQGNYGLYVSADNGATVSTSMNQIVNASAYRDIDFGTTPNTFAVTFKANCGGSTDGNYDGVAVLLVDPTLPVEAATTAITTPWGNINDVSRGTVRRDTTWSEHTIYLDNATGVRRLVFFWFNQATASTHPFMGGPAAIDSVSVYQLPCDRPYGLEVADISQNNATITWEGEANADYVVLYRRTDETAADNISDTVTGTSYSLTSLTSNTSYYFWVRKLCDATHSSPYSTNITFTTDCGLYFATDTMYEDFHTVTGTTYSEQGYLPNCWEGYSNGTNTLYDPHVVSSGSYWYTASDNNALIMTSGSEAYGNTKIVRLPRFIEPVNSLTLSYWMCTESSTNGVLSVGYLTGDNYATDFVSIKDIPASTATMHSGTGLQPNSGIYDTVVFDSVPANAQYIAFKWVYTTSFYSCFIDNVQVTSDGVCPQPIILGESHDYESITVTWDGIDTAYEINLKASADLNWSSDITVSGNSYTFTGLQPATNYTFRVRQNCSAYELGYSDWVETSFITDSLLCLAPASLHTTAVTNADVTLDWTPSGTETAWDVRVWTLGGLDTIYPTNTHPVTISGLAPNVTYNATVRTLCGNSENIEGDWSDTINFTTPTCPNVTSLTTSDVTFNSVTLHWDADPMAQSWTIEYGYAGFTQGQGTAVDVATNSYTVMGLLDETAYDFHVKAVCATDWVSESWASTSATTSSSPVTTFTVTATSNDETMGTVLGGGIYGENQTATLTAQANEGHHFVQWNDGVTANPREVVVTCDTTFTAFFAADADSSATLVVYVASIPERLGFTTDVFINEVLTNQYTGRLGDEVSITVAEPAGFIFESWSDDASGLSRTITLNDNYTTLTAYFRQVEGIDDIASASCTIYPNPTSSATTISVSGVNGKVRIAIVDMNGREVATETIECASDCVKTMDVDNLAQGAYFVRITGESVNMVKKLIVR